MSLQFMPLGWKIAEWQDVRAYQAVILRNIHAARWRYRHTGLEEHREHANLVAEHFGILLNYPIPKLRKT